ncbi:hypothetical protein ACT1U9_27575 [Streptomyces sp. BR1]|uniref:hypothetical protein n=1 Tax=Streptomyces sp. BR1 TaxID=1592323 RepID=UPI00402B4DD3
MAYAVAEQGGGTTEVSVVADGVVRVSRIAGGQLAADFSPAQAREFAAVLVRAAGEAESVVATEPVSVKAQDLRRGDVRDGERSMAVDRVKVDEAISTAHVTWKSDVGRTWTQSYAMDTDILLKRRGPQSAR